MYFQTDNVHFSGFCGEGLKLLTLPTSHSDTIFDKRQQYIQ